MKERPILFSAPMVRAILEGRKTQTRRIIKPQPIEHDFGPGGVRPAFILLEVTGVRVERLQDISAEDCLAEGVRVPRCGCEVCATGSAICPADASELVFAYRALWESINGPGSWDANPWVWVVEFRDAGSQP